MNTRYNLSQLKVPELRKMAYYLDIDAPKGLYKLRRVELEEGIENKAKGIDYYSAFMSSICREMARTNKCEVVGIVETYIVRFCANGNAVFANFCVRLLLDYGLTRETILALKNGFSKACENKHKEVIEVMSLACAKNLYRDWDNTYTRLLLLTQEDFWYIENYLKTISSLKDIHLEANGVANVMGALGTVYTENSKQYMYKVLKQYTHLKPYKVFIFRVMVGRNKWATALRQEFLIDYLKTISKKEYGSLLEQLRLEKYDGVKVLEYLEGQK